MWISSYTGTNLKMNEMEAENILIHNIFFQT